VTLSSVEFTTGKITTHIGNERRLSFLCLQFLPVNDREPRVTSYVLETLPTRLASKSLARAPFQELFKQQLEHLLLTSVRPSCAYSSQGRYTRWTTLVLVFRKLDHVLHDRVTHLVRSPAIKWALVEYQFIRRDTEAPEVTVPCVPFPPNHLRSHVRHATCDTCVHTSFREVDGDIKVRQVGVALGVQEDVVGLYVTGESG
jgi:hypothetical protein